MEKFVKVAQKQEIPEGEGRTFDVEGKQVAVFNSDGKFCAISEHCPHRGGPLGEGYLENTTVICPWHGWQFDVTTGESPVNPAAKVPCYKVKTKGENVYVEA